MRLRSILFVAAILVSAATAHARWLGDINGDDIIDVVDINILTNFILSGNINERADISGDGELDVLDLNCLINIIIGRTPMQWIDDNPEKDKYDYVWDMEQLPEIHIEVSLEQWNQLLSLYDGNAHTKQYIMANTFTFVQDGETTVVDSIGLRLKGNTSRRRPEGEYGQQHNSRRTQWRHVHFGVNLRKYCKDEDHTIKGVRKFHLKWFKDDPNYVRELFCYNLFRSYGVWTAPRSNYCRLWLKVEGDRNETYFGVYCMNEPIDENYLKDRKDEDHFGSSKGNLWKCKYSAHPATLTENYNGDYWYDDDSDENHTYTLQTNTKSFDNGKAQFIDFMLKLHGKGRESFYNWINQICDVDLLLKTYAVTVAVGMWDDYWNNGNNYYLYFTTEDIYDYKLFMIPYDYDNTLGTSMNCGNQSDAGRQNPLEWGVSSNPLMRRMMEYDDFKAKYIGYLKELVAAGNNLMGTDEAKERVVAWQEKIRNCVSNETGEDMSIYDAPAPWGNHSEYRLLNNDPQTNYFMVKAATINGL